MQAVWALFLCVWVLCDPGTAVAGARAGMTAWATAFVPSLFPFFVMLPYLRGDSAAALCRRLGMQRLARLLGCPDDAAGALLVAAMGGSPAGALALAKGLAGASYAARVSGLLFCSGLSPAFYYAALGASMLGDAGAGARIWCAQVLAALAAGCLLRGAFTKGGEAVAPPAPQSAERPVASAVSRMLVVCGYMTLFSAIAALACARLPSLAVYLLPLLEIASGCSLLAGAGAPLPLIAFFCGLGGLCVAMQNLSVCPVKRSHYALGKLIQAALAALFALLLGYFPALSLPPIPPIFPILLFCALLLIGVAPRTKKRKLYERAVARSQSIVV